MLFISLYAGVLMVIFNFCLRCTRFLIIVVTVLVASLTAVDIHMRIPIVTLVFCCVYSAFVH